MKFAGIDYGTKRIGIAISDENGVLAFPKEIILNDSDVFKKLEEIFKKENVQELVIGESNNFLGEPNPISIEIESFILELKNKFYLPIHKQKEFLTSVEARKSINLKSSFFSSGAHSRVGGKRIGKVDAKAATLILQRYLDSLNNKNK